MLAKIGHTPPPFALRDHNDENATPLEDNVMGDFAVLVFDRNPAISSTDHSAELLSAFAEVQKQLNGTVATIFVISRRLKMDNVALAQAENIPFHLLTDEDGDVFRRYGIELGDEGAFPACVVLDPNGRVVEVCEDEKIGAQAERVLASLREQDALRPRGVLDVHPPVLVVPNAMEPELCEKLIEVWHRPLKVWDGDGQVSEGIDREKGDVKVRNAVYGHVVQYLVRDPELGRELDSKVLSRVVPQMDKAFGYSPTKREEYRIACYDAEFGGGLPAHRDNPTPPTQHRRFTVSVNLNNGAYEGGELAFRESSDHVYDVPAGTAIVWSCSLLHEVLPVTSGRRFMLGAHLYG